MLGLPATTSFAIMTSPLAGRGADPECRCPRLESGGAARQARRGNARATGLEGTVDQAGSADGAGVVDAAGVVGRAGAHGGARAHYGAWGPGVSGGTGWNGGRE